MAMKVLSQKEKNYQGVAEQCTQCGKCSSGCPAARFLELRPRLIALSAQRDELEEMLETAMFWQCTQCHQCMERCPREITPYDIIIFLQNLAVKEGLDYPSGLDTLFNMVNRLSAIQEYQEVFDKEFETYDREDLGLPELEGPEDMDGFRRAISKVLEED